MCVHSREPLKTYNVNVKILFYLLFHSHTHLLLFCALCMCVNTATPQQERFILPAEMESGM